jgi:hypothetical protein
VTTGKSFTTLQAYAGPLTSAEWIQEAPTIGRRVAQPSAGQLDTGAQPDAGARRRWQSWR